VMLLQIRGGRLVTLLTIPPAAWIIVALGGFRPQRVLNAIGVACTWILFSGLVLSVAVRQTTSLMSSGNGGQQVVSQPNCFLPRNFAALSDLAGQRILTPVDLGSHMLLYTGHSVVAAPYHRNQEGVRAVFDFLNGPIENAKAILVERGISMVVTCGALPEMSGLSTTAPDSFLRLAASDTSLPWITRVSQPGDALAVYEVRPH
jgi:hypothetical protein